MKDYRNETGPSPEMRHLEEQRAPLYQRAVQWIAERRVDDQSTVYSVRFEPTVQLTAQLFDRTPAAVAEDVISYFTKHVIITEVRCA